MPLILRWECWIEAELIRVCVLLTALALVLCGSHAKTERRLDCWTCELRVEENEKKKVPYP
jgi:hypothetical protein